MLAAFIAGGAERDFSFGVIADVQYADQESVGTREYRLSPARLEGAVEELNQRDLAFVIQLGDLIDQGRDNLLRILEIYQRLRAPRKHVLGNHDLTVPRSEVLPRYGLERSYYDFTHDGWRFIVLDGMDLSVAGGWPPESENHKEGQRMLDRFKEAGAPNAVAWNGGIGRRQLDWLRSTLASAGNNGESVILFCHFPVLAAASTGHHLLWNHDEVLSLLVSNPAVKAWFNGHDHKGGYAMHEGIHFVTVPGMVEKGAEKAYGIVEVSPARLRIKGSGSVPSRTLVPR